MKVLLGVVAALALAFVLGPRVEVDADVARPDLPPDLDRYLENTEATFDDLVPGTEKTILWAGEPGSRTPYSIVYLHGFSASRGETAPLTERLGETLGANVFLTRLTGHGRTGEALAEATVNDWLTDAAEAYAIGEAIGSRVILVSTSMGSGLATWIAAQAWSRRLAASVFISPNFGPVDGSSEFLTWPWGQQLAELVEGPERSFQTRTELHQRYWTERYPTRALLPMMGLVKLARGLDMSEVDTPTLVIYSPEDTVVDPAKALATVDGFGADPLVVVPLDDPADESSHVLAGDALAAADTDRVHRIITDFLADMAITAN